jgi:hypothetical protein
MEAHEFDVLRTHPAPCPNVHLTIKCVEFADLIGLIKIFLEA